MARRTESPLRFRTISVKNNHCTICFKVKWKYLHRDLTKTRSQMESSFDCHSVNKILYTYWLSKKILSFYHVNTHNKSFPTMYNTWGLREWEWRMPKNTTFCANLRAIFPNYLTSRRSGDSFGIANLFVFHLTVMTWYWASKWAIRKLGEGTIVEVMAAIVKHVTDRGNISKSPYFA